MSYVDGYVIPVLTSKKEDYRRMANLAAVVFRDKGATDIVECWADDVPDGKVTDFKRAVNATAEETVVFSWIVWPSKEVRDVGMKEAMEDPRMADLKDMPVDGKRMIFGGFAPIVGLGA